MLCNMDKNQVLRSFNLQPVVLNPEQPEEVTTILTMDSYYPGEYAGVIFHCECEMETEFGRFYAYFKKTSGSNLSFLSSIRRFEIRYFVCQIMPLFNPLNKIPDEVSQQTPSDSEDQ